MHQSIFPDPGSFEYPEWIAFGEYIFSSRDVVTFGVPLTVKSVREAYRKGIFPWFTDGIPLPWHCPRRRAVLEFDDLHIPRSLEKARRNTDLTFTIDKDFASVIRECALTPRPDQMGTWITRDFESVFGELHELKMVHSVEAWSPEGELVGGLYGVDAGGVFCGESMFYKQPNASKLSFLFLVDHLRSRGATWIDNQVMTPHFKTLGSKHIDRDEFLDKLKETQLLNLNLFQNAASNP